MTNFRSVFAHSCTPPTPNSKISIFKTNIFFELPPPRIFFFKKERLATVHCLHMNEKYSEEKIGFFESSRGKCTRTHHA